MKKYQIFILALLSINCSYTTLKVDDNKDSDQKGVAKKYSSQAEEYWNTQLQKVRVGMTQAEVEAILPTYHHSTNWSVIETSSKDNIAIFAYWIDVQWKVTTKYFRFKAIDKTGNSEQDYYKIDRLAELPLLTKEKIRTMEVVY